MVKGGDGTRDRLSRRKARPARPQRRLSEPVRQDGARLGREFKQWQLRVAASRRGVENRKTNVDRPKDLKPQGRKIDGKPDGKTYTGPIEGHEDKARRIRSRLGMSRPFGKTRNRTADWSAVILKAVLRSTRGRNTARATASATTPSRETSITTILLKSGASTPTAPWRSLSPTETAFRGGKTTGLDFLTGSVPQDNATGRETEDLDRGGSGSSPDLRKGGSATSHRRYLKARRQSAQAAQCDPDDDGQSLASQAPFPGRGGKTTVSKLTGIPEVSI
ncbi:hypothetical protein A4X09_0g7534 [Tilletia walkeri]|uniref:Uncharacterized protein n=1 Tax=Tilletia walkeri TaxID=117179 RepID=A0A8X7N311_9BASI|nr:hypothetical protein A4X09_0g7534 [Tilletia walkeri]